MGTVLTLTAKDLRQRMRDRSALIYGLIAPLGLAFIFSALFGDLSGASLDLRLGTVNEDGGTFGDIFVDEVLPTVASDGLAELRSFADVAAARAALEDGELTAVFVVPEGFTADVLDGRSVSLSVLGDVESPIGTQLAGSIARSFAAELRSIQLSAAVLAQGGAPVDIQRIAADLATEAAPLRLSSEAAATRQLDTVTYLSAGMAVFFLFFTVQFGVTGLLEERRLGTLSRLLAAPIRRESIHLSKALTSIALGLVAMTVLVIATDLLVGASWGQPVGVALLVVSGVLAATGLMSVVATFAEDAEQANVAQSIVAVVLGALGGAFFPLTQSGALASLSLLTPHRWFLRGLARLAGDGPISGALPSVAALLAFAAVGFAFTVVRLRSVEELS